MNNLAEKMPENLPQLVYGTVLERKGQTLIVATDYGHSTAHKAVSCMIQPEPGDYVLLSLEALDGDRCFVLSVLQRDAERQHGQEIVFEGPVKFQVNGGDLALSSDQGLTMAAEEDILCVSERIEVQAAQGDVRIGKLDFLGRAVRSQVERVVAVAKAVEKTYDQVTQRMKNSFRYVEEHDEVQSKTKRQLVEESLTVQSKNEYHLTEEVVKIDAEQIHLG